MVRSPSELADSNDMAGLPSCSTKYCKLAQSGIVKLVLLSTWVNFDRLLYLWQELGRRWFVRCLRMDGYILLILHVHFEALTSISGLVRQMHRLGSEACGQALADVPRRRTRAGVWSRLAVDMRGSARANGGIQRTVIICSTSQ